tara:strand:+ start:443 stop:646 length:204 start_codon:yes stop_codon:yes gene_type:complete
MPDYKKRVPSPLSETSRDKHIHASLRSENEKLMKQVEELKRSNEDKTNIILLLISIYGITIISLWKK